MFETFLLTLRKFLSVILRMNTLFSPSRVRVLPEKLAKPVSDRMNRLEQYHLKHFEKDYL